MVEKIYKSRSTYTSGKSRPTLSVLDRRDSGEELMGQANASERGHASGPNHVTTE